MRAFEFESYDESPNEIRFFDDSEISVKYNTFGYYREDTDFDANIEKYKNDLIEAIIEEDESLEDFEFEFDENDSLLVNFKTEIENIHEFIDDFDGDFRYYPEDCYGVENKGKPKQYIKIEDYDDSFVDNLEGWLDEDGNQLEESDFPDVIEYTSEWNGHNWRVIDLTSDYYDTGCTEITDELGEDFTERIIKIKDYYTGDIAATYDNIYYDPETNEFFGKYITNWQGSYNYYFRWDDRIEAILEMIYEGEFEDEEWYENLTNEVIDCFDLKKGEELVIDSDALCLKYRGHEYHFSLKEANELNIKKARNQIKQRRIDKILESINIDDLQLDRIFVSYDDSIKSGNCEEVSIRVKNELSKLENIEGDFAVRADVLLKYRNDEYTKRAILKSYERHYLFTKKIA